MGRLRAGLYGAALGMLALFPQEAMAAARSACHTWANSVMPALFPYMVLSQLLLSAVRSPALTAPLAMLGGSPAGARLISLAGYPARKAQRMAALCATTSPLFILGTLRGGYPMLLAHWLGAFVAWGFASVCVPARDRVVKGAGGHGGPSSDPGGAKTGRATLAGAIREAALAMITVCGCMALFSVLTALLSKLLPLPPTLSALLAALLEMAAGCGRIQALGLPAETAAALLCAAVSFGGLSVFMQNAVFLKPLGIDLRALFAARAVHAAASGLLCYCLYRSLPI